jgi:nicotinamide-nucleotide amidase
LASALQLNDGVIRGLLERLAESKMVTVTETGVQLSKVGKENLRKLLRQLSIKKIISLEHSDLAPTNSAMGIHVSKAYRPGMTGIVQRDEAIKAGAEGSITVAVLGKKLVIPPDNKSIAELAPKENARLRNELEPADKDLIIIGFGTDAGLALAGALAAVLSLQKA